MIELTAAVAGVVLAAIGVLHVMWAGTSWPLSDRGEFAVKVVGRPMGEALPRVFATLAVAVGGLLVAAGYLVAARAGLLPDPVGGRWTTAGVWAVAGVLLVRGGYGLAESGLRLGVAEAAYRRLDLRVYSPLCLLLGGMTAAVALA